MIVILAAGVSLSFENPLNNPEGPLSITLKNVDFVITGIFAFEMICKLIAHGMLLNGEKSYLRNFWNVTDFIILILALISILNSESKL